MLSTESLHYRLSDCPSQHVSTLRASLGITLKSKLDLILCLMTVAARLTGQLSEHISNNHFYFPISTPVIVTPSGMSY